tara:strand:- start:5426 stop:6763 length:1338 start_codon:yes stop_codon:yes gene_type:complete
MDKEAICAIATPAGSSALGIIRVSGKDLSHLIKKTFSKLFENKKATLVNIYDKENILDKSIVIYYKAPKSYTGEDMIEIICHGNHIVMNSIVNLLIKNGARNARPGEFSERAFFNNKINLTQAEAVADLISASDNRAVKAAQNSLSGKFEQEIVYLSQNILSLRAEVESIINFPEDDDVPEMNLKNIQSTINKIISLFSNVIDVCNHGATLNQRKLYAFVGKPNSGKSSLINCLLRKDASIVSDHAGTTRDAIEYELNINNKIVNIIDTAGIRNTSDDVEQEGILRTLKSVKNADKVFYIVDDSVGITEFDKDFIKKNKIQKYTFLFNKIDLTGRKPCIDNTDNTLVYVSARDNLGINLIKQIIEEDFSADNVLENTFLARSRHVELLQKGQKHLMDSKNNLAQGNFDFSAEDLRLAHVALSSILGQNSTEDLLNEIFSSFCIGK